MSRLRGAWLAAVAGIGLLASAAAAQQPAPRPAFLKQQPSINEALDGAYGEAIVETLATLLGETADASCVTSRRIGAAQWRDTSRKLLVATHEAVSDVAWRAHDAAKADAAFARHGGSLSELHALSAEPKLAAVVAAQRDAGKTRLVSLAVEKFAQFSLLQRYRRLSDANPLATGDERLLRLSEAADDALDAALVAAPPELVARLTKQSDAIEKAVAESLADQDSLLQWGPSKLTPVLEPLLAAVCVVPHP